jgi:hypothetical protein
LLVIYTKQHCWQQAVLQSFAQLRQLTCGQAKLPATLQCALTRQLLLLLHP